MLSKKPRDAARLSEEALVVVCPNPKCRKEIGEPILLTIRSVDPPTQYEACPYCFTKLEPETPIEQEDAPEPMVEQEEVTEEEDESTPSENSVVEKVKDSSPGFLQRVKALIPSSNGTQKEKIEKPEKPQAEPAAKKKEERAKEELEPEPIVKEAEPEEEPREEELKEEPEEEEPEEELKEDPEEELKTETVVEKETKPAGCPETFGYLSNRPPDVPIPQQCLVCSKMVDCMLSPRKG
jgi:hypothetical protein